VKKEKDFYKQLLSVEAPSLVEKVFSIPIKDDTPTFKTIGDALKYDRARSIGCKECLKEIEE